MPGWLDTILQIILFIFCLSTLIIVHEAGHLAAAKIFNVYCDDFSIGFGKAFFSKRRKTGETSFSLRILPFGGFVAMAAEEGEIREGVSVPKERTIAGTKKWKAAIIMSAGVIVNFIVAILLLYISNQAFITQKLIGFAFDIKEDSIAYNAGFRTFNPETNEGSNVNLYGDNRKEASMMAYYSFDSKAYYENEAEPIDVVAAIDQTKITFNDRDLSNKLSYYQPDEVYFNKHNTKVANFETQVKPDSKLNDNPLSHIELHLHAFERVQEEELSHFYCTSCGLNVTRDEIRVQEIEEGKYMFFHKNCTQPMVKVPSEDGSKPADDVKFDEGIVVPYAKAADVQPIKINVVTDSEGKKTFEDAGLSMYKSAHWQSFTEAWTSTFEQFGAGSSMIFTTLGNLFIGKGWDQVGSIVSIFNQQTQIAQGFGASMLFYYYGLISVNLAIFNLLPFPGLDGWQLLVIAVEGVTRKKIPDKAKAIMSYVGLGLLFVLMIFLLIKDFIVLF